MMVLVRHFSRYKSTSRKDTVCLYALVNARIAVLKQPLFTKLGLISGSA